jgi:hypothetical protein
MLRRFRAAIAAIPIVAALAWVAPASADPISGAIFTTDASGVPVNLNIYAAKEDVDLNGGPGINAHDSGAGLPAGTYSSANRSTSRQPRPSARPRSSGERPRARARPA